MKTLSDLLTRTSRTFALSIRLLPSPLRRQVTIAYLLFRVADTLEDADRWTPSQRVLALAQLEILLRVEARGSAERAEDLGGVGGAAPNRERAVDVIEASDLSARWAAARPCDHDGYLELVRHLPVLLEALAELPHSAQATIVRNVRRTISGMRYFLSRGGIPCELAIVDLEDLRRYCYVVAGIVGEMLTELFAEECHLSRATATALWEQAGAFGEGLQLVNILKDADEDARAGRSLLPAGIDRARLFEIAHHDLDIADLYVTTLRKAGASWGVVGFTLLPVRLARGTLVRVANDGPGAKLTRADVFEHLHNVTTIG